MPEAIDMRLFFPRTRWTHGRPDWMRMGGLRSAVMIDVDRAGVGAAGGAGGASGGAAGDGAGGALAEPLMLAAMAVS